MSASATITVVDVTRRHVLVVCIMSWPMKHRQLWPTNRCGLMRIILTDTSIDCKGILSLVGDNTV